MTCLVFTQTIFSQGSSLPFPIPQQGPDEKQAQNKSLYIKAPSSEEVTYNPKTGEYTVVKKMGGYPVSTQVMTADEYSRYSLNKSVNDYWKSKSTYTPTASSGLGNLLPGLNLNTSFLDKLGMGKDFLKFDLKGSIELTFALVYNRRDDPAIDLKNRQTFNFNFDSKIDINLNVKIGDNISFDLNHNTDALFKFDNKLKLQYEGKEDQIIKNAQAGNVSFQLPTTLIRGVQDLFGLNFKLQFGNTYITAVFSQQRSESKNIKVEGGAQSTEFNFKADEYEENRHYFLNHYFRDHYHDALSQLPLVNTQIKIVKIEVWVTNIGSPVQNNRNIVAFTDLGELHPYDTRLTNPWQTQADDEANDLLHLLDREMMRNISSVNQYVSNTAGYTSGNQYEKVESARRLNTNEYTFNSQLGFVSLNQPLNNDQVLAVAYQYQIIGDSTTYQVGEFSDQGILDPKVLIVKLLKATTLDVSNPLWKLMMKNVYSLKSYQVSSEDFRLNILYAGDELGIPTGYFKDGPRSGIPLIRVFGMDNLDNQQNRHSDGVFDFIDGAAEGAGYVQADKGLIYLPYVEPFGKDLIEIFGGDSVVAKQYAFNELYTKTKTEAQQFPDRNKYYFSGNYKSSHGSEISLGAYNLPQGSVTVMAGNNPLTENVDYTVNYTSGIVQITNQGVLNSGVPINISTEAESMSTMMTKRMIGLRAEHFFSKNFKVGATFMNLHQSPIQTKVVYGEEPISNTIYGFDVSYEKESRWLTKAVDAILPFGKSKSPSRVSLYGEFAHFIPGHASAINKSGSREGVTYMDDFDGSKRTFNLKEAYSWYLASVPQKQPVLFPESENAFLGTTVSGVNRAKIAWYIIDPVFYNKNNNPPSLSDREDLSQPYSRRVTLSEVFPTRELANAEADQISTLNIAFYPDEKGPYNYDVNGVGLVSYGIDRTGKLLRPESRWGGIMHRIDNTDFEASNVEYIEFWLMDPFIGTSGTGNEPLHSGGKLYFNLGDISEDILRDSRKSFEHGLPISSTVIDVDTTQWGRVPKLQPIVNAFDNAPDARRYQDIGLDGLSTTDENTFFSDYLEEIRTIIGMEAYSEASNDPSSDDFRYFRGSYWDQIQSEANWQGDKILARYKYFNNPEGNSPSSDDNTETYPTQATNYPTSEDINGDNTLSEAENYFQYEVSLSPDKMFVGQNNITDVRESTVRLENGLDEKVKWYQFKIPIRKPDRTVGTIQNFQSIRFIRMFLQEFKQPVILRFATLDLVISDWRKYTQNLYEDNIHLPPVSASTTVDVSAVGIEENSDRTPVRYVLPPGLERQLDYNMTQSRQMNEQSISLKITNLADGDARGVYKTVSYDMRQFEKLEMFVHLEKVNSQDVVHDGDVVAFVRFGTDFQDNYYEYEIPLKYTNWGESARDLVWPAENNVAIDLKKLVKVKENRDGKVRQNGSNFSYNMIYTEYIDNARYTVKGTPTISAVKSVLIGVRNPQKRRMGDNDDGEAKSIEVWMNELSLAGFSKESGVAATARMQTTLGDVGNISVATSFTEANFGQIEDRIMDLSQENILSYDVAVNMEGGKFLPEKAGIRLPIHYDISSTINNPEYNPLNPDVKTANDLKTYSPEERAERKKQIQDYTIKQNVNFINVRKDRVSSDKKPMPWDIENFNVSYSYSETKHRNVDVEYDNQTMHRGGIGYDFSIQPKYFVPLGKTKMAKNKLFAFISDFNFNYIPNKFSFSTNLQRDYNENKLRDKSSFGEILIEPTFFKRFDWIRTYTFRYDLTKSITLTYNANANSFLREPFGAIDTKEKKDSIWQSFLQGGSMRNFDQVVKITYDLPVHKLPYMDWVKANVGYGATYRWDAGALAIQDRLGNTISNNRSMDGTGKLDFVKLYNFVPYLKKINTTNTSNRRARTQRSNQVQGKDNEKDPKEESVGEKIAKGFLRFLMLVRDASITYNRNESTVLPGFMPQPDLFGNDLKLAAPGFGFSFGSQKDIRAFAAESGWLSKDSLLNTPFSRIFSQTMTARATIEPFTDFRITLSMDYGQSENHSSYYKYNWNEGVFKETNPMMGGNYKISTILIATAFAKADKQGNSDVFDKFLDNRVIVAERLASENPYYNGQKIFDTSSGQWFPYGYKSNQQEVMLMAFLAAYSGSDASKIKLSPMGRFPLPNWNLNYNGLTKIKAMRKVFKNFTLSHAYTSSYNVGSYTNNLLFKGWEDMRYALDPSENYISQYIMDGIVLREDFAPLIKVSATLQNDLSLNFEYRKSRQLGLSFVNNQLTESNRSEWVIGAGYRIKDVGFRVNSGGSGKRAVKSDIVLRADLSLRDEQVLVRRIDQNHVQPSSGAFMCSLNTYAEYEITKQLSVKAFIDFTYNSPYVASQYLTITSKGGFTIIYKLVQ
ncbi:MAG: cell surface protein SprA [Bacteroidales bacterium]|nr:cell surface protein SprA [Bacteroidales bacterium]